MRGVPRELIEHELHLDLKAKPINQRLPHFAQDKKDVMKRDIARLLDASFIKDVYHLEWLANPLLVLEKNKDMQKKDPFGSSRIDQVVDSMAGCSLLSFLDCYSGYHQIPLKEED
jgi:hypothetical protein